MDKVNDPNAPTTPPPLHPVITIGRQFGSGGRELGQKVAALLGIAYYDKELLAEAARHAGVTEQYMEENDERAPHFLSSSLSFNMGMSPIAWYQQPTAIAADSIYGAQADAIRRVAMNGPCVIVGRTSDFILRDFPGLVNVFVHAPAEECIKRINKRAGKPLSPQKARQLIEKTNRLRASFYNFYTDKRWGEPQSYHMMLDTSAMPIDSLAEIVVEYVRRKIQTK